MKNSNLAQMVQEQQAIVVPFPKQGRQTMSNKQEGFSPLPNFLVDDRYIAELPDQSVTLLVVLNRHLNQQGANTKPFAINLAKELSGFKDTRTAEKYLKVLVAWRLANVIKQTGKVSLYSLDFTNPKPTKYLLSKQPPTCHEGTPPTCHVGTCGAEMAQPPTCHEGTPPTCHVGTCGAEMAQPPTCHEGTPPTCHGGLIKNFNKEEEEGVREKIVSSEQHQKINTSQFFVEYKNEDWTSYSFKQVTEKYPSAIQDFMNKGLTAFSEYTEKEIYEELKKMSTWSVSAQKRTAQKWMVVWLNTFLPQVEERKFAEKRLAAERKQAEKNKPSAGNVNACWADQIAENKLDPNFVPDFLVGEEFS